MFEDIPEKLISIINIDKAVNFYFVSLKSSFIKEKQHFFGIR